MPSEPFPFPNELFPADWFQRLSRADLEARDDQAIELDLGCGDGSFLIRMASLYPDRHFLGVERLLGRVRKVSRKAERAGLSNVRVLRIDSNYAVRDLLPKDFASRIHFLCPDPWPKHKHASRRQMAQPWFLRELWELLVPGGELLFKTDAPLYHAEAVEVLPSCPFFTRLDWPEDAFPYPTTDFEEQWLEQGRTMHRLRLGRVG